MRLEDGYLGWAYLPYLSEAPPASPTHLVAEPVALVHAKPDAGAELRNRLFSGTAVCVSESQSDWARLSLAGGQGGWVQAAALRALDTLPADGEARRRQIVADAQRMVGVPYLWGGCSAVGDRLLRLRTPAARPFGGGAATRCRHAV